MNEDQAQALQALLSRSRRLHDFQVGRKHLADALNRIVGEAEEGNGLDGNTIQTAYAIVAEFESHIETARTMEVAADNLIRELAIKASMDTDGKPSDVHIDLASAEFLTGSIDEFFLDK